MTINIMHLYYDLLNLYGESGNIKALKKYFEAQGIKTNIHFLTLTNDIKLDNIDIIYIGYGTKNNQSLALKHILKYKKEIKNFIDNNGYVISTGNSIELFGKTIDKNKALNIFNYNSTDEGFRIVDEALYKTNLIENYIIGFQNQERTIKDIDDNHLFEVIKGTGSYPKSKYEGYSYKNFYGTYLIGPLLVRNPDLLEYICKKIIKEKNTNFKFKKIDLKLEKNAHLNFTNNYYKEYIK